MSEGEEQPLSQVTPFLVAALVCDTAAVDPNTNKKSLIGIFDRLNVNEFPTQHPASVYFKITDAEGRYSVRIRYVRTATGEILANSEGEVTILDRLVSSDYLVSFGAIPVPEAGRYEFQIWANGMFLGTTFVDTVQRPAVPQS